MSSPNQTDQNRMLLSATTEFSINAPKLAAVSSLVLSEIHRVLACCCCAGRPEIEEHKLYVAGVTPTVQEHALRDLFGK